MDGGGDRGRVSSLGVVVSYVGSQLHNLLAE